MSKKWLLPLFGVLLLGFPSLTQANGQLVKSAVSGTVAKSVTEGAVRSAVSQSAQQAVAGGVIQTKAATAAPQSVAASKALTSAAPLPAPATSPASSAAPEVSCAETAARVFSQSPLANIKQAVGETVSSPAQPSAEIEAKLARDNKIAAANRNAAQSWQAAVDKTSGTHSRELSTFGNQVVFLVEDYETGVFFENPVDLPLEQLQSVYDQSMALPILPVGTTEHRSFVEKLIVRDGVICLEGEISKAIQLSEFLDLLPKFMEERRFARRYSNIWSSEGGDYRVRWGSHEVAFLENETKFPHVHLEQTEKFNVFTGKTINDSPSEFPMLINRSYHILINKESAADFVRKYPGESISLLPREELNEFLTEFYALIEKAPMGISPYLARLYKFFVRGDRRVLPELYTRLYHQQLPEEITPYTEEIILQESFGLVISRTEMIADAEMRGMFDNFVERVAAHVTEVPADEYIEIIRGAIKDNSVAP